MHLERFTVSDWQTGELQISELNEHQLYFISVLLIRPGRVFLYSPSPAHRSPGVRVATLAHEYSRAGYRAPGAAANEYVMSPRQTRGKT